MAYQSTQETVLALIGKDGAAMAGQEHLAALLGRNGSAINFQVSISVLYDPTVQTITDAGIVTFDLLVAEDGNFYSDRVWGDVLLEEDGDLDADRVIAEVLFDFDETSPRAPTYEPMSDFLFPTLPGLEWGGTKEPKFSTQISPHVSGREVRASNYAYPIWTWELSYEFLRAGAEAELQTLMGFFLARSGSFDTFLYDDPDENNALTGVVMGTGDNTQTKWSFYKTYAGFTEPCGYVDQSTIRVYFNSGSGPQLQLTGWTFTSPNQISFSIPVPLGTTIIADYTWYYRVRFGEDAQSYAQFMFQLWELNKVTLQSVKP
ncbi:MAG: DUF2460 domain-containing protein [Chlorobiaceae bacterium]|nr:DUF2460 domain-containing protein [Chlorobiaceae bacterium]